MLVCCHFYDKFDEQVEMNVTIGDPARTEEQLFRL